MSAVLTGPEMPVVKVQRRCRIDEVFARPFIELITLAPRNPCVRGLILAQTRKLPGADCVTFEQVREWVETTCDKPVRPPQAARTTAGDGLTITVEFSETQYGRADYSVLRSGSDEFALDADELLAMVREAIDAGEGVDAVVNRIAEEIEDNAWDRCEPSLEDCGDYDYDDHNASETGDSKVEFSRVQVRDRLLSFLREQHPERLEELA